MVFKQTNSRIGGGDGGISLDLEAKMVGGGGGVIVNVVELLA